MQHLLRIVLGEKGAKHIAEECGIYRPGVDLAMEGADFRVLSNEEIQQRLQTLTVLARSKPQDKKLLVDK